MRPSSPYQKITAAFALSLLIGALLLMLPISTTGAPLWETGSPVATFGPTIGDGAPLSVALFTAISAGSVTGLIVADTATYWTHFGQAVLLVLMEIGGIGTMTVASFVAVTLRRKISVRRRIAAAASVNTVVFGDVNQMLKRIIRLAAVTQTTAALILTLRFWLAYDYSPQRAIWHAVFHAGSAYNNAGFSLYTDSLIPFNEDPIVIITVGTCIVIGGLGFPVFVELLRDGRVSSMHGRIMIPATAFLITVGAIFIGALEWNNSKTLGALPVPMRILNALFASISPRTAGFNALDISQMRQSTWLGTDFLMLIGAGPASTGGGLKVTTIVVIIAVAYAQIRGRQQVIIAGKRLAPLVLSQVVTLVGLVSILLSSAVLALLIVTPFTLDRCLFEVISAFGTVGLSTGITASLPAAGQIIIMVLMFTGRIGPVTLATSLALRSRALMYQLPEDRPLIG